MKIFFKLKKKPLMLGQTMPIGFRKKNPPVLSTIPKQLKFLTISISTLSNLKTVLFGNLPDFLKIIILIFLVLPTNFQRLQYSNSTSRLRCNSSLLSANTTMSSAYSINTILKKLTSIPDKPLFINTSSISFKNMENKRRTKILVIYQPHMFAS